MKLINKITINQSPMPSALTVRSYTVFGDPGAVFSLTVINEDGHFYNFSEEVDSTKTILNIDSKTVDTASTADRTVPLLNQVGGTNTYQRWLENTENKIGNKFYYKVSTNIFSTNPEGKRIAELFKSGIVNQEVYDKLPIMVESVDNASRFTYLPIKYKDGASQLEKERYDNNYAAQRKIIIDKIHAKESTVTEVKYSSGGDLVTDAGVEEGMSAENKLTDLQQITSAGEVKFLFTNSEGEFWTQFKQLEPDFAGKVVNLGGKDSDKNQMAYRGGIFIKVKKADGKTFPLRVNLARNTDAQASALSELLIDIVVPITEGDKVTKVLEWKSFLSDVQPELKTKLEEVMGPEIEFLGGDPNLLDLINMFVYVSDKTLGLTSELYTMNHHLVFGNEGERITPGVRKNSESIDFIIDQKIVSTNATTKGPMFQDTTGAPNKNKPNNKGFKNGRRIQLYLAPLSATPAEVQTVPNKEIDAIEERRARTIAKGAHVFNNNTMYLFYTGTSDVLTQPFNTMEEALAKYDTEVAAVRKKNGGPIPVKTAPVAKPEKVVAAAAKIIVPKKLDPKSDIEKRRQKDSEAKVKEIVNRGETEKQFKPITKRDRKVKVDFDKMFADAFSSSPKNKSSVKEAKILLKKYLKDIHPDKFQDKNKILVSEIFTTAMITVGKKGDINKLNELYEAYKKINAKYDSKLAALEKTQQSSEVEGSVSDGIKKVIEQVYPGWINNATNQIAIAAEFKGLSLLSFGESSIKDRISFGKEAFNMLQDIKKGKKPFTKGTTAESQMPNLLYSYISGELAKDGISESDMYSNVLGKPTLQASGVEISAPKLVEILNLKQPTVPGINRILGLGLTDESAVNFLESKGVVSKIKGSKGRSFLMSKEDALNSLKPTLQTNDTSNSVVAGKAVTSQSKKKKKKVSAKPILGRDTVGGLNKGKSEDNKC